MENSPAKDFLLKFGPIYNKEGEIIDYLLVDCSDNFYNIIQVPINMGDQVIGKKITELAYEYNELLDFQEYYFFSLTKAGRKYELYNEHTGNWYYINLYKDDDNNIIVLYTDISSLENRLTQQKKDIETLNLQYYCFKDKLTDLYTKDFLDEEIKRLDTERQWPLSIIMGDLNGLKLINDAFGHRMGDRAIKMVANTLKESFRKEDIISRIGGDEFLILLPKTSKETAAMIIENLKSTFSKKTLSFIPLSVTFGVATKQSEEEDIEAVFKRAEDKMYFLKLEESKEAKLSTIQYLKDKLKIISFETKEHINRLIEVSHLMAERLNFTEIEKEELKLLCEFHDIGKIGVPHHTLLKEGLLNDKEWCEMKRHSEIGYHIIRSAKETLAVDELILVHHERWDGKGYPRELKGLQIPLIVRLFSIVDAYVAMTEGRPYKNRISHNDAVAEIINNSGLQFDPGMVKVFQSIKKDIKNKIEFNDIL